MKSWNERTGEEQRLLNPSFCSILLWHAAQGHYEVLESQTAMRFEEAFLILPIVLHRKIRESLPNRNVTSLAVWLDRHPLVRATITDRARLLVPYTKEALRFGGIHDMLRFSSGALHPNPSWRSKITLALQDSSEEVRFCAKRARSIGRLFARTGNAATVMSLLGVSP